MQNVYVKGHLIQKLLSGHKDTRTKIKDPDEGFY